MWQNVAVICGFNNNLIIGGIEDTPVQMACKVLLELLWQVKSRIRKMYSQYFSCQSEHFIVLFVSDRG